ncbi:MAG: hypothetical protein ACTSV2_16135 [Candidatus Thorarchaeota archaeon]
MKKAILIAANPLAVIPDSDIVLGEIGSIIAHVQHLVRHGGVFWDVSIPGPMTSDEFPHEGINTAYFYDVPTRSIAFRAEVDLIGTPDDMKDNSKYEWYMPKFRRFREMGFSYLLLLRSIERLDRNYSESDFLKISDGKPVERVQNYVLIEDPEYPSIFKVS